MDSLNINNAHEVSEHRMMKREGIPVVRHWGYTTIFPEHHNADLFAVRILADGRVDSLALEAERSSRNVWRNVTRDAANGAHLIVVVASNESVLKSCTRVLKKKLSVEVACKVFIITFQNFIALECPVPLEMVSLNSPFVRKSVPLVWPCTALYDANTPLDQSQIPQIPHNNRRRKAHELIEKQDDRHGGHRRGPSRGKEPC